VYFEDAAQSDRDPTVLLLVQDHHTLERLVDLDLAEVAPYRNVDLVLLENILALFVKQPEEVWHELFAADYYEECAVLDLEKEVFKQLSKVLHDRHRLVIKNDLVVLTPTLTLLHQELQGTVVTIFYNDLLTRLTYVALSQIPNY
jgi:hypothetical protein